MFIEETFFELQYAMFRIFIWSGGGLGGERIAFYLSKEQLLFCFIIKYVGRIFFIRNFLPHHGSSPR